MTARLAILLVWIAAATTAQTPVTQTPQAAGERLGENVSNYNIVDNFETGHWFHTVGGNLAQSRSSINFGGLGSDPYKAATLHVEKTACIALSFRW